MKDITSSKKCLGCMVCVDSCNKNAIVITNIGGILYPQIDTEKCVNCNACQNVCPAIHLPQCTKLEEAKVFAVWSIDDNIRLNAASGGFCTQMGVDTIERGGYVATVIMRKNRPTYILTNNIEELLKSSNSKYVQGNPVGIYRQVKDILKNGDDVLFCGLPCYCAALKNFLKKDYENLMTIELVCSAPPSIDAIDMTLKHCKASELNQFRKKIDGGMWGNGDYNLVVDKDRIIKQKDTVFYRIFASMMTARYSCMNCQFANIKRVADFAAADFHGYHYGQYQKGVSLVIAKNEKAVDKLFKTKGLQIIPETWIRAINSNHRLYNGYDFLQYHPGVFFRKILFRSRIFKKMCLNNNMSRMLWIPFKAITKIVIKFNYIKTIKVVAKLDNMHRE